MWKKCLLEILCDLEGHEKQFNKYLVMIPLCLKPTLHKINSIVLLTLKLKQNYENTVQNRKTLGNILLLHTGSSNPSV